MRIGLRRNCGTSVSFLSQLKLIHGVGTLKVNVLLHCVMLRDNVQGRLLISTGNFVLQCFDTVGFGYLACKNLRQNDLSCVGWDVLTHLIKWINSPLYSELDKRLRLWHTGQNYTVLQQS